MGVGLLLVSGACTAVNPAYDGSDGGADTVPGDTDSPPATTEGPEPTVGVATTGQGTGDSGPVETGEVDTGVGSEESGTVPECDPETPGRALDIRIVDANTGACADELISGSLTDIVRVQGTNHYVGRICDAGCGGLCAIEPVDRMLRIELPADLAEVFVDTVCMSLDASVDANDDCRVDHITTWPGGQDDNKPPYLVGVTEAIDPFLIGSNVAPNFEWSKIEECAPGCGIDADVMPGRWAVKFPPHGDGFVHGEEGPAVLSFNQDTLEASYLVRNLRSFVPIEACELQAAWVALAQ